MHYNGHLPIGPSCAVAEVTPGGARIFSNTQDAYNSRGGIQAALGLAGLNLPAEKIRVSYVEGSSVFGTSPYDDTGQSAAVLSYLAKAPVRLQLMRWDEHGWDHYGPAQLMDVRGAIDANGNVVATDFSHFSIQFYGTEAGQQQLGATPGPLGFNFIDATNMGAQYKTPNQRVTLKQLPNTGRSTKMPPGPHDCTVNVTGLLPPPWGGIVRPAGRFVISVAMVPPVDRMPEMSCRCKTREWFSTRPRKPFSMPMTSM